MSLGVILRVWVDKRVKLVRVHTPILNVDILIAPLVQIGWLSVIYVWRTDRKKGLLRCVRIGTGGLGALLTWRFFRGGLRIGLNFYIGFAFLTCEEQRRIHKLLLCHHWLICVLYTCLLLIFKILDTLRHGIFPESRLLAVRGVCKVMKVFALKNVRAVSCRVALTGVVKSRIQSWLWNLAGISVGLNGAPSAMAWKRSSCALNCKKFGSARWVSTQYSTKLRPSAVAD